MRSFITGKQKESMNMSSPIRIKGITWDHSRGYTPLVAAAQRFGERVPHVSITWDKRTLQQFADYPIQDLVKDYDLLIIDHPWVGYAADTTCVLPLDEYLPASFMLDQELNTVGNSHRSYYYEGHQWALAIDAATPVASYRKDLLTKHDARPPDNWEELLAMARSNRVAVPAIPIDLLMNFYTFCIALGKEPFASQEEIIDRQTGLAVLDRMRSLWSLIDRRFFACNPIQVAEIMTIDDRFWYCPFAYGYSNYSRRGYADKLLHYTDVIRFGVRGERIKTTLGGTGIAVSAYSEHKPEALEFAEWIATPVIQSTFYVENGGQPGHRSAWEDAGVNSYTHDYFSQTLPALDRAYTRPRYKGYLSFQDRAGVPLHNYLQNGGKPEIVLEKMNEIYQNKQG